MGDGGYQNPFDTQDSTIGTMTATGGLSPDDPLRQWAQNLSPDAFKALQNQYATDPQGAVQKMIDAGHPPPDHNYVTGADGQLQAVNQQGQPLASPNRADPFGPVNDPSQSNLTGPRTAYQDYPEQPGEQGPNPLVEKLKKNKQEFEQAKPYPPGQGPGTPPIARTDQATPPAAAAPATPTPPAQPGTLQQIWRRGFGVQPQPDQTPAPAAKPAPAPAPTPQAKPPADSTAGQDLEPPEKPKTEVEQLEEQVKKTELQQKLKKLQTKDQDDAISGLAKTLQGVKMPEAPKYTPLGAPAVRSPVAVQPNVQNLLGLVGQRPAAPQVQSLMKLLGRA